MEVGMSQENIDRYLQWLQADKDQLLLVSGLSLAELVEHAAALGFVFTVEELKARQALVHLMEGT